MKTEITTIRSSPNVLGHVSLKLNGVEVPELVSVNLRCEVDALPAVEAKVWAHEDLNAVLDVADVRLTVIAPPDYVVLWEDVGGRRRTWVEKAKP